MTEDSEKRREIEDAIGKNNFNPMNDAIFKFIFGRNERKSIMVDFLNAVLEESLEHRITDIVYIPTEQIPLSSTGKTTRFDVACELDTGEFVDVEVQVVDHKNMDRRTLLYWAQMYSSRSYSGEDYGELRPAITINIVSFILDPRDPDKSPHSEYSAYKKTGWRLNNHLELHFIEIPKFVRAGRKPFRRMTRIERWMEYFSNRLNEQEKEELAMSDKAIGDAYAAARVFFKSPEETMKYINRELAAMDARSGLRAAREEGEKLGEERGEERGLKHGEERVLKLIQILTARNRSDDIARIMTDEEYRQELYREFSL
jgi:predicted transposase/invertase (TIGR01784 family)|nr:Rpn family recombination-promoting nuclease/putative transposase [Succinivibrionaceae bacterium]